MKYNLGKGKENLREVIYPLLNHAIANGTVHRVVGEILPKEDPTLQYLSRFMMEEKAGGLLSSLAEIDRKLRFLDRLSSALRDTHSDDSNLSEMMAHENWLGEFSKFASKDAIQKEIESHRNSLTETAEELRQKDLALNSELAEKLQEISDNGVGAVRSKA